MKIFRLEEANALLPKLRPLVAELVIARRDFAIGLLEAEAAQRMQSEPHGAGRSSTLSDNARGLQARAIALVDEIQAYGCIVKDLDLGLLDFPALRAGQLVNLCWKMDEPLIAFWHRMDEGFASRKSLSRRRM
ncbi:MAG TPA: DUF2203 domain-containing protein [Candidatus Eremiobacteraceae bacterium]|nr:DUF2203 domain-containing protein [Candidatus Eremiobacteraceae bacterium]